MTGATRGLGRAIAIGLARQGAHVICTGRTVGALEELDDAIKSNGGHATLAPFDLREGQGIEQLSSSIAQRWGRLDMLAGNAGVLGDLTPVQDISARHWDEAFAINVTANWRLIRSCHALLRASDAGRAVFVTSSAAAAAKPFWGLYATTKAALETLVRTYAHETATTPIRVNLVSPGPLRTAMRAKAMPGENAAQLRAPKAIVPDILMLLSPAETRHGEIIDLREAGQAR